MSEETGAPEGGQGPETEAESQAAPDWMEGFADEQRNFVTNKGWKGAGDVLTGYQNLEKLLGADRAGRTVVLPKEGEDAGEFWQKLGRPDSGDGYEIAAPEGTEMDPDFVSWARSTFLDGNLTKGQAAHLVEKWNAFQQGQVEKLEQAQQAREQEMREAARKSWGPEFDAMRTYADRALARFAGEGAAELIEQGGFKTLEIFAKVGRAMAEDQAIGMREQGGGFADAQTIQAEIANLQGDQNFLNDWLDGSRPGHANAVAKMNALQQRLGEMRAKSGG